MCLTDMFQSRFVARREVANHEQQLTHFQPRIQAALFSSRLQPRKVRGNTCKIFDRIAADACLFQPRRFLRSIRPTACMGEGALEKYCHESWTINSATTGCSTRAGRTDTFGNIWILNSYQVLLIVNKRISATRLRCDTALESVTRRDTYGGGAPKKNVNRATT